MARLPAILRLSPKYALASNAAFFAKAVARAAAKPPPPPPSPPQYSSPQVVTSTQWNGGGAPFQHVQTTSSSLPPGYGVYSPEYLQQLQLNTESPIYGPQAPECFDTDFPNFDPLNQDEHFPPVDIVDDAPLTGEEGVELAEELAEQISEGRGLDLLEETDLSRAEAIEQLEAGGYEVESSDWGLGGDNITRTTITDPESGETIHEYYDHDTDRYWIEVTDADGEELSSSGVRDEEGRKVTVSEDEETGGTTTRTEDDLGDGSIVETTVLPDSDVVTVRTVDEDGNSWTVVIAEDGTQTVLEPEQETTRDGVEEIVNGVTDGQSIEDIAEEQGLTREQVIAQLAAVGFEFESAVVGEGPGYVNTTKIIDQQSGDVIVSHETGPDGTQTSVVIEPNGNVTETVIDTDGTTTTTVTYEQNGITVEEITVDDGETTTTIIDEDGERTELEPEQEPTREGIDEIAADVADGKSIDEIAEERGLSRDQLLAQLRAANYVVEVDTNELANGVELYTTKIVDAEDGEEVIARYSSGRGAEDTSVYLDAEGNEVRRTEYQDGRSVETIIDVDGRRTVTNESADGETTTRVTHNGYTVTTPPDGDLTVRRDEDGVEVTVERGTTLEAMVETLMAVTLDSDDTEDAQAAEVVLAAVERALAGESFEELYGTEDTDGALAEHQKALDDLIEKYGLGQPADRNVTDDNPYGDPPLDPPPSGDDDDWVLMGGHWVDPEVAKAWAELNVLEAELHRAAAEFERSQAQLNLFASDPAYEEALQRAANMLDEALAPHNFRWVPPTPEGSLDDARAQLERAENQLESVSGAVEEFQAVEPLLDEVASAQRAVPDKPLYICTSEDTSADLQRMADVYEQELSVYETAQAKVDALFSRIDLHNAQGGKHLVDYQLLRLEEMSAEVDPNSEAYEGVQEALEEARGEQERVGMQVSVAQGYYDFHAARHDNLQLTVDAYDVREQLLAAYNEDKGFLEEGKTFSTIGGKYLGELTGEQVVEEREDGLWVITHFEKGSTEERLTPEEMDEWWENNRDPELTSQWIDLRDDRQAAHEDVSLAGERLHETLGEQADAMLESLDASIEELEQELGELTDPERHGPGSTEMPEELFPEGTEPQEISVEDHELLVTPQMAEEYEERGLEVLLGSDQPVGIEIDGDWRWVHPEVAMISIALDVARRQRTVVEEVQTALAEQATRYGLMADEPMQRMNESDADFMGRLEYSYLEGDNRDKALDGLYQPLFQALEEEEQGFDSEFSIQSSDADLKTTIEETYGLSGETEEGQEAIDDILDEVRDIGGDSPEVKAIPLFHLDQRGNMSQVMLLAVRSDDGDTRYISVTGRSYSDLENFGDKNQQFREDGHLIAPRDLEMQRDDGGSIPLEVVAAKGVSQGQADAVIATATLITGALSFVPVLTPVMAPLTLAGGAYLGGRAIANQVDHVQHGGDWNDSQSLLNYLSIATSFFPAGGAGIRALNMPTALARAHGINITRGQALMASTGAVRPGSELAINMTRYMRTSGGWNRVARGLDWGAITSGVPLMLASGRQLAVDGDQMTTRQKVEAFIGLATGFAGTALGTHALLATRPQGSANNHREKTPSPQPETAIPATASQEGDLPQGGSVDPQHIEAVAAQLAGPGIETQTRMADRATETQRRLTGAPETERASVQPEPSVRPNLPETEGRARVYRLEDLEALNQASQDGALPPGHHVHLIRTRGLDTGAFTLQSGTVPRSGKVGDDGHFRWPEGREVNPVNRDGQVYAVVSELSAGQVREQFRSGEGLPFAVYAGKNAWLMPNRIEANESQQVQPQLNQAAPDGINVTVDSEGVVHLGGVVDNWVSVAGSSYRKRPSLFDKKGASQGLPETVNISRETLEQLLGTEVAKALPDGSEIRVAIGGERDAATSGVTPVRNGDDGVSKSRIWTARGSASAFAGGGLLSIPASYGSDGNGWTGSVLDRTLAPDSPALMLNGAGFVARGVLTAIKARYDNSIRLNNEALDKGEITAQLLNWDVSRIISSRRALGLSKIEAASVGNLAEALWGKYQLLNNLPVTQQSAQRGWTEKAKQQAIDKAVLDYRTEVKKFAGEEALTINPLDPRTIKSVLFNSAIATTHMINNYVSFQFIMNGGLVDSSAPLFMQIVDKSVLVGFLVANTALGATALAKVGTGLARVDLSSLPGINKATKIGTFAGSALYGVATPPWIAVTLHTATEAFANGNHFLGAMSLASLPFQIGLAYYGLKGFRNDYITMMETVTKDGRVPQLAWPIKTAFAGATIPLAALVSTEAVNQFALGNYAMGGALTSAAVLNAYMISLGSRLSWTDGTVHHGPSLRPLSGAERQRADMQRAILGIGVTLGGAMGTLAMTDVVDWLDEREWVPENEWLTKLRAGDADDEMTEEAGQGRSIYAPFPVIPPASPLTDEGGRIEPQHTPWEEELVLPAAPSFVTQLGDRSVAGGVSAGLGRLDADLEKNRDYYGISVEPGQTLGGLAIRHGVGVEEVVMLNIGHIGDPNSLAPGDRVYLPRTDKVS